VLGEEGVGAVLLDHRGTIAVGGPEDGEEAFVEGGVVNAAVAAEDVACARAGGMELDVQGEGADGDRPSFLVALIAPRAVPEVAVEDDAAAWGEGNGDDVWVPDSGFGGGIPQGLAVVEVGGMEEAEMVGAGPAVGAGDDFQGAVGSGDGAEGYPAGGHRGGVETAGEGAVAVEADGGGVGGLDPAAIHGIASAIPSSEGGVEAGNFGGEGEAGDGAIAPPHPRHLTGGVGLAEVGAAMPFVGVDARFQMGGEERIEAAVDVLDQI